MPGKISSLPANVRVLEDPRFASKIDQLRDRDLPASKVRAITTELSQIVAREGVSKLSTSKPTKIALIVVLRAGLQMQDPFLDALDPSVDVVVYHLGLFREKKTLEPVEYYNKLPSQAPAVDHAFVVDPLVATGGTAIATIDILKSWGVKRITFLSILSAPESMEKIASVWPEGTEFIVGHLDDGVDAKGYITPGIGDIGDRLYGTGKS